MKKQLSLNNSINSMTINQYPVIEEKNNRNKKKKENNHNSINNHYDKYDND